MSNFGELKDKINEWSADEEDILLRKLKDFTDNYVKKCEELGNNLENINKYVSLVNVDYFNSLNTLKNVSIKKFVEHIVDTDSVTLSGKESNENLIKNSQSQSRANPILLSKEEREANLLTKFKSAISKSLENLNIKTMLDIRVEQEKESVIDDDNVSVSSSRYFANNMNKGYKNMKLPFIIGTQEFFRHEYLGVYQGDSLISDHGSNMGNNNENANYERRATTVEINVDELNLANNLIDGTIDNNNRKISNIPNIPNLPNVASIPAVPGGKSNIPPIPNGKIPSPPINNFQLPNNNNVKNIQSIPNVPAVPNIPTIPPQRDNQNIYNHISNIEISKEENPVLFKDTLNKMFSNNNVGRTSNLNPNINNIQVQNSYIQQPSYNPDNFTVETRQTKMENVIKRPTIFDNVMDDDDDNDLFKRGIDRRHFTKSNLFDNVIPQANNNKIEQITNTNISTNIPKNDMPTISTQFNQRDTLQSFSRESNVTNYTQLNNNNIKPATPAPSTNLSNLIENKNKNLEKAKSNLLKIFDDDEDEDTDKNMLISSKINEKTVDLNNKLNLVLDTKKDISKDKKEEINVNIKNKPYENLVQNINIGLKADPYSNTTITNQNNLNNTSSASRQIIKRPIFIEDDEEDINIMKSGKNEVKSEENQTSNKNVIKSDPLSSLLNNSASIKASKKKEDIEIKNTNIYSSIPPSEKKDEISDTLKEVDFGLNYMKEDRKQDLEISQVNKNFFGELDKSLSDKNASSIPIQKSKISFDDVEEEIVFKSKDKIKIPLQSTDNKNLSKPKFDIQEETEPIISKQEEKLQEKENNFLPTFIPNTIRLKPEETITESKIEKIENQSEQEKVLINNKEEVNSERTDTSIKMNGLKMSNRFSDLKNILGGKLNFNPMMRPSAIEESTISSRPKEPENKIIQVGDEENNYEKIVSEKTAVINKKKPKIRMFNSNMNMNSNMTNKSIVEENIKPVEDKKINNFLFDKIEDEIKEEKVNDTEKFNELPIATKSEESIKLSPKNEVTKNKFNFDLIVEKNEEPVSDIKVSFTTQTQNFNQSSGAKKPSVLFDFEDSAVIEAKNPSFNNKNKLQENSNSANKKSVDKKIKFLFEDE